MRQMLPFADWPEADREAWQAAGQAGGLFEETGPAAGWSAATRCGVVAGYSRWLAFLSRHDRATLSLPPDERATVERFDIYLVELRTTCGAAGCWNYAKQLLAALRVLTPDRDRSWLAAQVRVLEQACKPRHRPVVHSNAVVDLGETLMAQGLTSPDERSRRRDYRDGLLLAFLAYLPLRRRNLAMVEVGRHLIETADGWRLAFEPEETKSGRPLRFRVPNRLAQHLDRYLMDIRPRFQRAGEHRGLWVSDKGAPLTPGQLYMIVRRRTREGLGRALSLHELRDCAASTIAERAPSQALIARDLLGHGDFRTTERHYIAAQSLAAGTRFADALLADRDHPAVRRHVQGRKS